MTLPLTRNTTYSPGSPIYSVDLNAIQDCIIGQKHGLLTYRKFYTTTLNPEDTAAWVTGHAMSAAGQLSQPMDVVVGDTIMSVAFDIVLQSGNFVARTQLWELIRAPGNVPVNSNNNPGTSANSTVTINVNQRVNVPAASLNAGAGVLVRSDAQYWALLNYVSGAGTLIALGCQWQTQRT